MGASWEHKARLGRSSRRRRLLAAGVTAVASGCGAGAAPLDVGMWMQPATASVSDGLLQSGDVDMLGPGMTGVVDDSAGSALMTNRRGPCGAHLAGLPTGADADAEVVAMEGTDAHLVQSVGRSGATSDALQRAIDADLRFGCPAFEVERGPGDVVRVDRVTPVTGLPRHATAWTSRVSQGDDYSWEGGVVVSVGGLYSSLAIRSEHRPQPPAMRALVDTTIAALERAHGQAEPAAADS